MATSAETAQKRYNEIASSLLTEAPGGVRFGHNQVRMNDKGSFETFDLQTKKGDSSNLVKQGNQVTAAINSLVSEFKLDTSGLKAGQALGSVRYDPGAGVTTSAKTLFDNIYNKYFADQMAAKTAGNNTAVPQPTKAAAPVAPMKYGQPAKPPAPVGQQPTTGGVQPGGNPFAGLHPGAPEPPQPNRGPADAPGWQGPDRRFNNLPQGPAIPNNGIGIQSAAGDPFMEYLKPVYRDPLTGAAAYDQMGIDYLAQYGMDPKGEHNFFPNRGTFKAPEKPDTYK